MRASSSAQMLPLVCGGAWRLCQSWAVASRVLMGSTGRFAPRASPCATEQAVRRPVNEPGPLPKTMAPSCVSAMFACASRCCMAGMSVADDCAAPAPVCCQSCVGVAVLACNRPRARESCSVLVSSASRRKGCCWVGVCVVLGIGGKAVVVRCIGLGSCYWLEQGVGLNHRW